MHAQRPQFYPEHLPLFVPVHYLSVKWFGMVISRQQKLPLARGEIITWSSLVDASRTTVVFRAFFITSVIARSSAVKPCKFLTTEMYVI